MWIHINGPDRVAQLEERRASISKVAGSKPTADRQNFLLVRFGRTHSRSFLPYIPVYCMGRDVVTRYC